MEILAFSRRDLALPKHTAATEPMISIRDSAWAPRGTVMLHATGCCWRLEIQLTRSCLGRRLGLGDALRSPRRPAEAVEAATLQSRQWLQRAPAQAFLDSVGSTPKAVEHLGATAPDGDGVQSGATAAD